MKKMTLQQDTQMTLADGCKKHYEYCRQRNLREGTLLHYQQGYNHFCSYFGADMPLSEITKSKYNDYIEYQRDNLDNEITLKTYVKDFATVLHFLMEEGYIEPFKTQSIKASGTHVETYTDEELQVLLRKPNLKTCTFREYESWVIVNFLFSTGVRRRSLINIRISDITLRIFSRQDFDLKGLQGDLIVRNVFGDEIKLEDVCFFSFEKNRDGYLVSSPFPVTLPDKISYGVSNAGLSIKRYIGNDKLEILQDTNISSIAEAQVSNAGSFSLEAFRMEVESLHNAAEIYNYVQQISETNPGVFSDELLHGLEQSMKMERSYGNMKNSAIKKLNMYYDSMGMK